MNQSTIRCWYDVFKDNNELVEIRILDPETRKTYSGYFTNIEDIVREVSRFDKCNIYFTLNVINPACYGREQKDKISTRPKSTTSDSDIIGRKWCLIDVDCEKPSDTNSTDEEKEEAKQVVNAIYKFLRDEGFEPPVICDSANGWHLLYKQAMKASPENTEIMKRFLQVLDLYFSTDKVKVDVSTFNNSRICKLYGTVSRKGSDTLERPQRESGFVRIPREVRVTKNEYFAKVASYFPQPEKKDRTNNYGATTFDLDDFLSRHGIAVDRIIEDRDYTKYILKNCPFNSSHSAPDSAVFKMRDGSFGFKCLHASDSHYTFRDFRTLFEPDAYSRERSYSPHRSFKPYRGERPQLELQENEATKGNVWQTFGEIEDEDRSKIVSIPSGITQLDAECCGFDKPSLNIWSGNNGCVDCDTEYFNGERWVKISEYKDGDMVLQYNPDGTASLVKPLKYHKYECKKLTLMTNATNSINQCLSDEHNVVYVTSKGNLYKQNFKQFKSAGGRQCWIIPHFRFSGNGIDWTDEEIKLALAISADGHLFEHRPNKNHMVRVNLKHQYKKDELEALLNACGIEYKKKKYCPRDLAFDTYLFHWDKAFKLFPSDWYNMSTTQLEIVKSNITKWDGMVVDGKGGTYSTTKKHNADFVQFCVTSLGYRCSISKDDRAFRKNPVYILHFSKNKSMIRCYKGGFEFSDYDTLDGYKYCFSVPSGMLVLRRNNAINITGNSAKSTLLNQIAINAVNQGFKVAIYSGELRGQRLKRWVVMQAAGKAHNRKSIYNSYDYYTPDSIKDHVVSWLSDKLYVYNTKYSHSMEQVCLEVETLVREKQIDMLIMDNLSCMDIAELDFGVNEQQKTAVKMLLRLTTKLGIATHLVVHPKKAEGFLRKNDVSGAKALTDLADSVFFCHRWNQDTQKAAKEFLSEPVFYDLNTCGTTNIVEVIKHREFGEAEGHIYKLYYEPESRRLKNSVAENVIYGWYEQPTQSAIFDGSNEFDIQSDPDTWGSAYNFITDESPF